MPIIHSRRFQNEQSNKRSRIKIQKRYQKCQGGFQCTGEVEEIKVVACSYRKHEGRSSLELIAKAKSNNNRWKQWNKKGKQIMGRETWEIH